MLVLREDNKKNIIAGDDHTTIRYYKEELQEMENSGRGGTEGAQLLKNYIRDLQLHVQKKKERGRRELEELNNAISIEEKIMRIITE